MDSVYYLKKGHAKLTFVSLHGKEASITHITVGDFIEKEAIKL